MKIVLIGAGNVAVHLGKALQDAHHDILQVYSRTEASARWLAERLSCPYTTDLQALNTHANVYIYALKDDVVKQVMQQVHIPRALHVHTAGSVPLYCPHEGDYGVIYPLQTFSKEREVDFSTIPICIDGNNEKSLLALTHLAESISKNTHLITTDKRRQLHLAAIFACNFVNCLYANAAELLETSNLPFKLLLPLIQETAAKVQTLTPRDAQTGPAKRADQHVMEQHLSMLSSSTQQEIYRLLSEDIHKRHTQPNPLDELR